jgi:hypothetical protein
VIPTPFQQAVLRVPEDWNLLLVGGRGGGKSTCVQQLILRHCEKYGSKARPLLIRETHKAISELEESLVLLFAAAYGEKAVKHNVKEHTFRLPNGAIVELGQLEKASDYTKYQGRSFTLLVVDEYGELEDAKWVSLLKSNLRAPAGIPLREVRAANPGGAQHGNIHFGFIARAPAWHPFEVDGETWVCCPSTMQDNPHLGDLAAYEKRIRAACRNDEDLARAWVHGDWNISRGAYFAGALDESVHRLPLDYPIQLDSFSKYIALDWGSGAPSVCYVCLQSCGSGGFPAGSVILIDELATNDPTDLNVGLKWPPSMLAEAVTEMCGRWDCYPQGVGDDSYGLEDTLLERLATMGVYVTRPDKQRISGWSAMRDMLVNAKERNGKPGLWISARCSYFWQTVPFLQRNPKRPEDILTTGPDHGADAARYGVMHAANHRPVAQGSFVGLYN